MCNDKEFQFVVTCACIVACVIVIAIATATMHSNYLDNQLKTEAMKAGYEQKIENHYVLWTKTNIEKAEQQ